MEENKKTETVETTKSDPVIKPLRQIIIETDGNVVKLIKAEVSGNLELSAIMRTILNNIER